METLLKMRHSRRSGESLRLLFAQWPQGMLSVDSHILRAEKESVRLNPGERR